MDWPHVYMPVVVVVVVAFTIRDPHDCARPKVRDGSHVVFTQKAPHLISGKNESLRVVSGS